MYVCVYIYLSYIHVSVYAVCIYIATSALVAAFPSLRRCSTLVNSVSGRAVLCVRVSVCTCMCV